MAWKARTAGRKPGSLPGRKMAVRQRTTHQLVNNPDQAEIAFSEDDRDYVKKSQHRASAGGDVQQPLCFPSLPYSSGGAF